MFGASDAAFILGGSSGKDAQKSGPLRAGTLTDVGRKKESKQPATPYVRKPKGMSRELYNILERDQVLTMAPSDTKPGYRMPKAQLSNRRVRSWKLVPFENRARSDGLRLSHYEREDRAGQPYPFAKFNKKINIPQYTDDEYTNFRETSRFSRTQTDHLFELARRFDCRWPIIVDRWDRDKFGTSFSMEDIKERFYQVVNELNSARGTGADPLCWDAENERRRKEQAAKLMARTAEEVKEEQELVEQLKQIDARKRKLEQRAHSVQKLAEKMAAAAAATPAVGSTLAAGLKNCIGVSPGSVSGPDGPQKRAYNRKSTLASISQATAQTAQQIEQAAAAGLRFPEFRTAGVHLRSHEMKLPTNFAQKKLKNIELALKALDMDLNPPGWPEIVSIYNELRPQMILLGELKTALQASEFELETVRAAQALDGTTAGSSSNPAPLDPRLRVSHLDPEKGLDPEDVPAHPLATRRRLTAVMITQATAAGSSGAGGGGERGSTPGIGARELRDVRPRRSVL